MARNNNRQQESTTPELQERVVFINRVAKTVKGGRRMQLSALVVVGDGNGRVGVGMGKSAEVPTAIKKGVEDAKKNMFTVPVTAEGSVPHEIMGEYGAGRVLIKPAVPGTGVLAGGPVRAIMELAGVQNVITKSLGTDNAMNIVKAAAEGLKNMESPVQVAERRGISVAEMFGGKEKLMADDEQDAAPHPGEERHRPQAEPGSHPARAGPARHRQHHRAGGQRERARDDFHG